MAKIETFAIALCVAMLAGLVVYTLDVLNVPGADLFQKAEAITRTTTEECPIPEAIWCEEE
jgi:hypothetical protein